MLVSRHYPPVLSHYLLHVDAASGDVRLAQAVPVLAPDLPDDDGSGCLY